MTAEKLNTGLIEEMRSRIPAGNNLANTLMDIMCIGKEAVYRRLRGEVPFTLAEAAIISRKMGISLDKLVGSTSTGNAIFDINLMEPENTLKTYTSILDSTLKAVKSITEEQNSITGFSSNTIPQAFYLKFDTLSKFRYFKWIYQHEKLNFTQSYKDLVIPQSVTDQHRELMIQSQMFTKSCFLLDEMLFRSLVNDLVYFASINLLNPQEIATIKEELLTALSEMESVASKGKYPNGNEVQMYISNVNFETSYCFMENSKNFVSFLKVFDVNTIISRDQKVCENVRDWIQSLKKFSTLISQSGEMQRIQYFNKQREIISLLD